MLFTQHEFKNYMCHAKKLSTVSSHRSLKSDVLKKMHEYVTYRRFSEWRVQYFLRQPINSTTEQTQNDTQI